MRTALEDALRRVRANGGKAFLPYVTGGLGGVDTGFLRGLADAGADAVEVGIPFSDPVMDGPVIQEASRRALAEGTTIRKVLRLIAGASLSVPVVVMTYLNPVLSMGEPEFLSEAASSGVAGVIVPDLPVDEAGEWIDRCADTGVAPVFLVAPNSSAERLAAAAGASRGFVYCVSTFGVTGSRPELSGSAGEIVAALRPLTDLPLLMGVGISAPEQAAQACRFADGVVVGSALVSPLLEGNGDVALRLAEAYRAACR
jgi:tryptophan synthase alpha chain